MTVRCPSYTPPGSPAELCRNVMLHSVDCASGGFDGSYFVPGPGQPPSVSGSDRSGVKSHSCRTGVAVTVVTTPPADAVREIVRQSFLQIHVCNWTSKKSSGDSSGGENDTSPPSNGNRERAITARSAG